MKLIVLFGVLVLAIVANAGVSMNNPFFCYTTDPIRSMTNMHSTSTSYEAIRRFNFTTVNPYISTCTPSRFWYLGRYGGRYPHAALMQQMIDFDESSIQEDIENNYNAGRTTLCRPDFEAIRDWTRGSDFNLANASLATPAGVEAMENIAGRFQRVFPDLLTSTYSADRFLFRHTESERTNTSIRAFATGLFGAGAQNVVYEEVPEVDWFLRPFDFCPEFTREVENWDDQREAFRQGPEVEEMVEEVNRKLGFQGRNTLDFDTIYIMWEWCRFETASTFEFSDSETGEDSTWCAPFSVAHHLLLEYYEDLGHFYFSGYGVRNQRLLENLNCGPMQNLLELVQSDDDIDVARIFVSYTQEVQSMLVALGSFRDTWPLHQHNYAQQAARHWLTSLIAPQASNLAVVRFDCDDEDDDLIFLLNERPILVPGCDQQTGVCKVSTFVDRFRRFVDANCEEFFCSTD
ncbi:Multiple inositol polyphosphate phosphatase 1 [Pseudolycoriella hygida]|uniref:Multiple inositol polyphosphate phosphatase 1 n=1 Tax=Pseudolycoriella hygida TaxID=35572 RepID=A0A9Q0S3D5_9DIPT|nr:Multiple inositol polyphosphate phosphatase 1 [Pseudolycoriella hygida]